MRFDHTVKTGAAPGDVWAVWADVARWPGWDIELESASVEGGRLALGARGTLKPRRGPASRLVVSEFESGEGYAFVTRLPLCDLVVRRRLGEDGDGGTAFTHEVAFVGPLSFLFGAILGGRFRAALPRVMESVRRIAEGRTEAEHTSLRTSKAGGDDEKKGAR